MEKSCWWYEGGMCYSEPVMRDAGGRSTKKCGGRCTYYRSKRSVLGTYIPETKLVIVSEHKEQEGE